MCRRIWPGTRAGVHPCRSLRSLSSYAGLGGAHGAGGAAVQPVDGVEGAPRCPDRLRRGADRGLALLRTAVDGHVSRLIDDENVLVLPEHAKARSGGRKAALFPVPDLDAQDVARADGVQRLCGQAVEEDCAFPASAWSRARGTELSLQDAADLPAVQLWSNFDTGVCGSQLCKSRFIGGPGPAVEADHAHALYLRVCLQRLEYGTQRDLGGLVNRVAIDSGADGGKSTVLQPYCAASSRQDL